MKLNVNINYRIYKLCIIFKKYENGIRMKNYKIYKYNRLIENVKMSLEIG